MGMRRRRWRVEEAGRGVCPEAGACVGVIQAGGRRKRRKHISPPFPPDPRPSFDTHSLPLAYLSYEKQHLVLNVGLKGRKQRLQQSVPKELHKPGKETPGQ